MPLIASRICVLVWLPSMLRHDDCYRSVKVGFLSTDLLTAIGVAATAAIAQGRYTEHEHSHIDKLHFFSVRDEFPVLNDYMADCTVPCRIGVQLLPPNIVMPVHVDDRYLENRQTCIATSLFPDHDIPSTNWYEAEGDLGRPVVTARWSLHDSKLLNIQRWHGGIATDDRWRGMLHCNFSNSFAEIAALIDQGLLFKNHACDWIT